MKTIQKTSLKLKTPNPTDSSMQILQQSNKLGKLGLFHVQAEIFVVSSLNKVQLVHYLVVYESNTAPLKFELCTSERIYFA